MESIGRRGFLTKAAGLAAGTVAVSGAWAQDRSSRSGRRGRAGSSRRSGRGNPIAVST